MLLGCFALLFGIALLACVSFFIGGAVLYTGWYLVLLVFPTLPHFTYWQCAILALGFGLLKTVLFGTGVTADTSK